MDNTPVSQKPTADGNNSRSHAIGNDLNPRRRSIFPTGIRWRLFFGFSIGFLLFAITVSLFYIRTETISTKVRAITGMAEPASASALEMEINLIGAGLGAVGYTHLRDQSQIDRVEKDIADFTGYLRHFGDLAITESSRDQFRRASEQFTAFKTVARALILTTDRRDAAIGAVNMAFMELIRQVESTLIGSAGSSLERSTDTDRFERFRAVDELERTAFAIYQRAVLPPDLNNSIQTEPDKQLGDFLDGITVEESTGITVEDSNDLHQAMKAFVDLAEETRELGTKQEVLAEELFEIRNTMDALLDEEIQRDTHQYIFELQEDTQVALDETRAIITTIAIFGFVAIGIAFTSISRSIIFPLGRLLDATRSATRGHFETVSIGQKAGELGDLATAFNEMTAARQDAEARLQRANEDLEKQVRARTTELLKTNESLLNEMEERERLNRQIIESQKMDAIGHLTGGIAHDFNNLLGIIIGNLDLLTITLSGHRNKRLFEMIDAARASAQNGADLIKQLLAFGRRQPLEIQTVDPNETIESSVTLLEKAVGERIRIQCELNPGPFSVTIDSVQLVSALINLCINARDAMPDGGTITITTRRVELDDNFEETPDTSKARPFVALSITDTGTGIDPETLPHLFEPFYTTKEVGRGTGLGLASVWGFVKQSHGHITVNTEQGSGSEFRVVFPLLDDAGENGDPRKGNSNDIPIPQGAGETILIVEDNAPLRASVATQLQGLGYQVVQAGNAGDALRLLKAEEPVDLVFSDIVMPGEMDGFGLADRVEHEYPGLPVIFTSGFPKRPAEKPGEDDPARSAKVLRKPYSIGDLAEFIRQALVDRRR